jgi:hypothetical protein
VRVGAWGGERHWGDGGWPGDAALPVAIVVASCREPAPMESRPWNTVNLTN